MPLSDLTQSAVIQVTSKALDAAGLRHLVIMSNIANAGNPLHVAQQVDFEEALRSALAGADQSGHGSAMNGVLARVVPDRRPVAIDQEIAALARNALHYQALLKTLNAELELLGLAANDGRR